MYIEWIESMSCYNVWSRRLRQALSGHIQVLFRWHYLDRVSHDSISGKMNASHCLSSPWPGFNSRPWQSIQRDFYLADHPLPTRSEPAWQKMAQPPLNGIAQPVDILEEGWSSTNQWLKRTNWVATYRSGADGHIQVRFRQHYQLLV